MVILDRIYNVESRKKPAELVRKDLISAMKLPDHELLNRDDYIEILDSWREEWEKGVQVPVNPDSMPISNVKLVENNLSNKVDNEKFNLPKDLIMTNTHDTKNYFNSSSYELDIQDICWLQALRESDLDLDLEEHLLEKAIDLFEMHCAQNIDDSQVGIEYDDHIVCDVCQSPYGEDGNEMVFCDLCNICVHQACYGINEIPDGEWLCKPCEELGTKRKNAFCVLCPNSGGALKPTTKPNKWAHVSCVYWIPEAKFLDYNTLEPIETKSIPNWRWNLICSLCNIKKGAPIICAKNCRCSYHVTCAFKHRLKMKIVFLSDGKSDIRLKSFCQKHTKQQRNTSENNDDKMNSKKQCEFWKYVDVNKISQEISQIYNVNIDDNVNNFNSSILKNHSVNSMSLSQILQLIYEYWKLKRISNHGNSLIKMTFEEKFQEQLQIHKNQILSFRYHLERLRTLAYMICRREKIKQNWLNTQREIITTTLNLADNPELITQANGEQFLIDEHQKLFSKIISNNSIFLDQSNVKTNDDNKTLSDDHNEDKDSVTSTSVTSTSKPKAEYSTNNLIKEIKHLKRSPLSKHNPYARIYLTQTKSRKSNRLTNDDFDKIDLKCENKTEEKLIDLQHKKQLHETILDNNITNLNDDCHHQNENIDSNKKFIGYKNRHANEHQHFTSEIKYEKDKILITESQYDDRHRSPLKQNGNNDNHYKKLRNHDSIIMNRKYPLRNKIK
uniref:PHD finger protein rhinoceros n=1 Tax=Psoroptes ovis TaxID=83912 RepID=A0A3B0QJJ1_PSOOV|nr:PHD finger protein rhinoceros [Psoroptes ovis]